MAHLGHLLVLMGVVTCGGGKSDSPPTGPSPATTATVAVSPSTQQLHVGESAALVAEARDQFGSPLPGKVVQWNSSAVSVASVGATTGSVTGVSPGSATISATIDGKVGSATVTVIERPVATVVVSLASASIAIGTITQATAVLRDSAGATLSSASVAWTSSNTRVASVNGTGVVTGVSGGTATISATSQAKTASAVVTVIAGPLTIRSAGTYSGTWASDDPNSPAVNILTTDPVIVENCVVRSKGMLIQATAGGAHVTVRNCRGVGNDPGVTGKTRGDFFFGFKIGSITIEHNYMEAVNFGVKLYGSETTPDGPIVIRYNQAKNLDGLASDGAGGRITTNLPFGGGDNGNHFFIISNSYNVPGIEVAWNEVISEPVASSIGDVINVYKTNGSSAQPILVHDNFIQGGYAPNPTSTAYVAGGITLDGSPADVASTATAFVKVFNNQIVNHSNFGVGIATGHDNEAYGNRVVSTGRLTDGEWMSTTYGSGIYVWDCTCYNQPATVFFNNWAHDNVSGWVKENADPNNSSARIGPAVRADYFLPGCAGGQSGAASKCTNNVALPDPITAATESNEVTLWQRKLTANGITLGPSP